MDSSESSDKPWNRKWVFPVALVGSAIVTTCAFFHRAIFSDLIFIARDIQLVYYPLRKYWVERVRAGEFPDWFPYDGMGQPFIGMVISGAFHPSNFLYLWLPLESALKLNIILCFPAAFLGVFCLCRSLGIARAPAILAGIVFAFGGYTVSVTNNLLYLMAAAHVPWALWAADRYFASPSFLRGFGAAVLLVMVLFSGDSQSFAVCSAMCGVLALARHQPGQGRSELKWLAYLYGLALLLSMVQILPAREVLEQGNPGQQKLEIAQIWSFHPLRMLDLFFGPLFAGEFGGLNSSKIAMELLQTGMHTLWVESMYVGLPVLLLATVGLAIHLRSRRAWLLGGTALLMFLLILGKYGGLYALVFKLVPIWRPFRFPEKLFPYLLLCIAIGAAVGFARVLESVSVRRKAGIAMALSGAICAVLYATELFFQPSRKLFTSTWNGTPTDSVLTRLHEGILSGYLTTGGSLLLAAMVLLGVRKHVLRVTLVPSIIFGASFASNEVVYDLTHREVIELPTSFVREIQKRDGPPKLGAHRVFSGLTDFEIPELTPGLTRTDEYVISIATSLTPVTPSVWGYEGIQGYLPGISHRVFQLNNQGRIWWTRHTGLFSTRYLTVASHFFTSIRGNPDIVVAEHEKLRLLLLKNPRELPRAYLTRPRCIPTGAEALQRIKGDFEPGKEALVECDALPPGFDDTRVSEEMGAATITAYHPERIEITADVRKNSVLVLNDALYRGWTATVDGRPTTIWPANYAVRGVFLEKGQHQVVFRYRTPGLLLGSAISLITLVSGFCLGLWGQRKLAKR